MGLFVGDDLTAAAAVASLVVVVVDEDEGVVVVSHAPAVVHNPRREPKLPTPSLIFWQWRNSVTRPRS